MRACMPGEAGDAPVGDLVAESHFECFQALEHVCVGVVMYVCIVYTYVCGGICVCVCTRVVLCMCVCV